MDTGGRSHIRISLRGLAIPSIKAPRTALPLASRWEAFDGCYGLPTYTLVKGICSVKGLIEQRSWNLLASLPATCRRNKRLTFL